MGHDQLIARKLFRAFVRTVFVCQRCGSMPSVERGNGERQKPRCSENLSAKFASNRFSFVLRYSARVTHQYHHQTTKCYVRLHHIVKPLPTQSQTATWQSLILNTNLVTGDAYTRSICNSFVPRFGIDEILSIIRSILRTPTIIYSSSFI